MILQNKKINFLGDSITEGGGASCYEKVYLSVIKRNCGLSQARNYGVGYTCIATIVKDVGLDCENKFWLENFYQRAQRMDKDADAIVVFGGTNDYGHGISPIGLPTDSCQDDTFCGWLNKLLDFLQRSFSNVPVLLVAPPRRFDVSGPFGEGARQFATGELEDYVLSMKAIASARNIPFVNLFDDAEFTKSLRQFLSADGLHPSDDGHKYIADKIAKALTSL